MDVRITHMIEIDDRAAEVLDAISSRKFAGMLVNSMHGRLDETQVLCAMNAIKYQAAAIVRAKRAADRAINR